MFAGATEPKEIRGTPLPAANFYNLNIVNGKDTDHYYVKVQWINMSSHLRRVYPDRSLYTSVNDIDQDDDVRDWGNGKFNNRFGERKHITLYLQQVLQSPLIKDHEFKIFVNEYLGKTFNITHVSPANIESVDSETLQTLILAASGRDKESISLKNALRNSEMSKLGNTGLYRKSDRTLHKAYIVVTKHDVGVFSEDKKTLIDTWKLPESFNTWYDDKRQRRQNVIAAEKDTRTLETKQKAMSPKDLSVRDRGSPEATEKIRKEQEILKARRKTEINRNAIF